MTSRYTDGQGIREDHIYLATNFLFVDSSPGLGTHAFPSGENSRIIVLIVVADRTAKSGTGRTQLISLIPILERRFMVIAIARPAFIFGVPGLHHSCEYRTMQSCSTIAQ